MLRISDGKKLKPGARRANWNLNVRLIGALSLGIVMVTLVADHALRSAGSPSEVTPMTRLAEAPEAIYSNSPDDSWNRIFYYFFHGV